MRRGHKLLFPFLLLLSVLLLFVACGEDADPIIPGDGGRDAPFIDGGGNNPLMDGSSSTDSSTSDAPVDTGPKDTVPPGAVGDLTATQKNHNSIELTWSAPGDDPDAGPSSPDSGSGTVAAFEIRYAKNAITSVADFIAGAAVTNPPAPRPAGQPHTFTVTGLDPATTYHFVIRARDAAGNTGALSNDASATTKPRAKLLITEAAVANVAADGFDFIEAIVTTAGWAEGIEVRQLGTLLHSFAPLDLAVGDRVVVHASGLPGPAGFAQEDVAKDKGASTAAFATTEAFDVYSATAGLTATDNLLTINDGASIVDALAISNRDSAAAGTTMNAWAAARTANQWTFAAAPMAGANDCASQRDTVNVAENVTDPACGGFATGYSNGVSINRIGTTDTNSKNDFYLAPQSVGAVNNPAPAFRVTGITATNATTLVLSFNGEVAPGTVNAAAFPIASLVVNAATAAIDKVTLTTATQAEQAYSIAIANTVTSIQGTALSTPTVRACGFSATPASVFLSEVNVNVTGGADLVELAVTARGNLGGFELYQNPTAASMNTTLIARLPTVCADVGDIVVVHLNPTVPVGSVAPFPEAVVGKTEFPQGTYGVNYDSAWDIFGLSGVGYSSQVLVLKNPAGAVVDAAAFATGSAASAPAAFIPSLQFIQSLGRWTPADCGGQLCTTMTTPTAAEVSASWGGLGTAATGNSVRRIDPAASSAMSWGVGASSFGLSNP